VASRKSFLLRIDPSILEALQRWADADLRSLNGQIEFVLRRVLEEEGRLRKGKPSARAGGKPGEE
jgi:hypothetical protein